MPARRSSERGADLADLTRRVTQLTHCHAQLGDSIAELTPSIAKFGVRLEEQETKADAEAARRAWQRRARARSPPGACLALAWRSLDVLGAYSLTRTAAGARAVKVRLRTAEDARSVARIAGAAQQEQ